MPINLLLQDLNKSLYFDFLVNPFFNCPIYDVVIFLRYFFY